jgi:hypothetical protein
MFELKMWKIFEPSRVLQVVKEGGSEILDSLCSSRIAVSICLT